MHAPYPYELYLMDERFRYGFESNEENDYPTWLTLEEEAFQWIFDLSHSMCAPKRSRVISKQLLSRINAIPSIRFLRYRDISPNLKIAFSNIAAEFMSLREDFKRPEIWEKPQLLSKTGAERWEKALEVVTSNLFVVPDLEWRENWERENVRPYCTRREAAILAVGYVLENTGINLEEVDPENGRNKYSLFPTAKNGKFKLRYGIWGKIGEPFHEKGIVEVDMLTRNIRMVDASHLRKSKRNA